MKYTILNLDQNKYNFLTQFAFAFANETHNTYVLGPSLGKTGPVYLCVCELIENETSNHPLSSTEIQIIINDN